MSTNDPESVALKFVDKINSHDVQEITDLMTEDHMLIIGGEIDCQGRKGMKDAWAEYFKMFPDYTITPSRVETNGTLVVIIGRSDGTITEFGRERISVDGELPPYDEYQGPALWAAGIKDDKVAVWGVYADNETYRKELGVS